MPHALPADLLWVTDSHLTHLSKDGKARWLHSLQASEALLLGGDFAAGASLIPEIEQLLAHYPHPVAMVLGNHDFYGSSVAQLRPQLRAFAKDHPRLTLFEPELPSHPLPIGDGHTWLCGTGGWGDSKAGTQNPLDLPLMDEQSIVELKAARARQMLPQLLRSLGDASAQHLQAQFAEIPPSASTIVVLTHVPPWPEASWHLQAPSSSEALPRFCCLSVGHAIDAEAMRRPDTEWLVLTGHTHTAHVFHRGKITCHTGGSDYGLPHLNGRLTVRPEGVTLSRLET